MIHIDRSTSMPPGGRLHHGISSYTLLLRSIQRKMRKTICPKIDTNKPQETEDERRNNDRLCRN